MRDFILENEGADAASLLLKYRGKWNESFSLETAVSTIESRKALKSKVPEWYSIPELVLPRKLSAEQCSSSATAFYKAAVAGGPEGPAGIAALGRVRGRGPSLLGKDSPARGVPDDGTYPKDVLPVTEDTTVIEITEALYRKVAYRESTEGIIAEVEAKENHLEQLELPENPLVVVLEGVEKPGNLGAVLRSADAAKADAVIVADPHTDLWNPNLIRASIGAVFTVPTFAVSTVEAIGWLQSHGFSILTAQLQDSLPYYDTPMTGPTAIVMGTESTGLTDPWRRAATAHIRIPMLGRLDSLNVSVSAAILLFEAVRQRRKIKD